MRDARWSRVTAGWEARKPTRGGASWRFVGRYSSMVLRNKPGSNMGTVMVVPPWYNMPDIVTFMAKMWYMGNTHMLISF